jgi:hypothetical protein
MPKLTVTLKADPNPDYSGDDWRAYVKKSERKVKVSSLHEASVVCGKFIDKNDLGSGNWTGGRIFDETGKQIAHVSYNGRVWEGIENPPHISKEINI